MKSLFKKIFLLPPLITVAVAVLSFSMVTATFVFDLKDTILGYASYIASAYGLMVLVVGFKQIVAAIRDRVNNSFIKKKIYSYPLGKRLLTEEQFRTNFFLYQVTVINILYAGFKAVTAIMYSSEWLGAIGAYYLVLSVIRIYLARGTRKASAFVLQQEKTRYELKNCRIAGFMLFGLDLAMAGMVIQMIWKNQSYEYPGVIIYLSAIFSFYCFTISVINIISAIRRHKKVSPIHMAVRTLNLAGALMSIFALQTAMLSQFGKPNEVDFRQQMNMITGGMVTALIIGMAVLVIIFATKGIKKFRNGEYVVSEE